MNEFWTGLSKQARIGLVSGIALILVLLVITAWYVLRVEYQVLFADLKPQDAQAMTAELDRLKIPYKLGDSGTAILVDQATVHNTRIKLMGKDFPLHGAVGFELFNNTDFGMTEFAQKINYQRALQGEITRTILGLAEVQDARVHLALPEQGLFKQATSRAKAAIHLTLRQGHLLRQEQITGIQRLVAAAVPSMAVQDVTIVDNRGVALTRVAGTEGETDNSQRLDLKRDTETHLSRKAGAVLDRVFGPGQALVSVDVTLNMEQMRVTTEDVLAAPSKSGSSAAGVIVRERETMRDQPPPLDARTTGTRASGYMQRDVDYAVGRRVEQVIGQPGSIRRIHAVVVVRQPLDAAQEEKVQRLLSVAVGAVTERGDTVVVQTLAALVSDKSNEPGASAATDDDGGLTHAAAQPAGGAGDYARLLAVLVLAGAIGLAFFLMRRSRPVEHTGLTEIQRAAALQRVQEWMQAGAQSSKDARAKA
jgi:flagellar M-ring protein FliF